MEIYIFTRFHSKAGNAAAVEQALRAVVGPSREENGCPNNRGREQRRTPCTEFLETVRREKALVHSGRQTRPGTLCHERVCCLNTVLYLRLR